MKFRNYLPHDKQLQVGKLAPVVLSKFEDPIATAPIVPEKTEVLYPITNLTSSIFLALTACQPYVGFFFPRILL